MIKSITLTALTAIALPLATPVTAAAPAAAPAARVAPKGMVTVKVNGLVCDFCVQALTRTFKREAAVGGFHVDLAAKEIHIMTKPNQAIADARIRKLVADAGYNVVAIVRS